MKFQKKGLDLFLAFNVSHKGSGLGSENWAFCSSKSQKLKKIQIGIAKY